MSGPVYESLADQPNLAKHYASFRDAAHAALDPALVSMVRQVIAEMHGCAAPDAAPIDETALDPGTRACLAYARRMPFEHIAISDEEAAKIVEALGEPGYVAFSVVAALADAECRAAMIDLPALAGQV